MDRAKLIERLESLVDEVNQKYHGVGTYMESQDALALATALAALAQLEATRPGWTLIEPTCTPTHLKPQDFTNAQWTKEKP